ncbi:ermin [Egretta garzetta]|uniref:ermin n=1 Tax=Egretta garzetta TaxID=188379 RepID=UPI00163B6E35|nr:ermin [Egretta garzetta]
MSPMVALDVKLGWALALAQAPVRGGGRPHSSAAQGRHRARCDGVDGQCGLFFLGMFFPHRIDFTEIPAASSMPECNGSVPPEQGPLPPIGVIDETAKSVGTAPYVSAGVSPEAAPAEENQEGNRNSLAEDRARGGCDGEKHCEEKREEGDGTLQQGPADTQDTGTDGQQPEEGPGSGGTPVSSGERGPGTAASPGEGEERGSGGEKEEEEEEEDTEEDEVQVIEIKENSEASCLKQQDRGKEVSPLTSPGCNSQAEKLGDQPSLGKKNDISRHSYSRYNTISYRRIRKGNTKQRIDEFESMMHL